jgi:hypothetical protein
VESDLLDLRADYIAAGLLAVERPKKAPVLVDDVGEELGGMDLFVATMGR